MVYFRIGLIKEKYNFWRLFLFSIYFILCIRFNFVYVLDRILLICKFYDRLLFIVILRCLCDFIFLRWILLNINEGWKGFFSLREIVIYFVLLGLKDISYFFDYLFIFLRLELSKVLDVIISSNLLWNLYINEILFKVYVKLGLMCKVKYILDRNSF